MTPALRLFCLALVGLCHASPAWAQQAVPTLQGRTLDGRDYDLGRQRGRVVMVVLWRSNCAVCVDKLPELRSNARGWKDAPFDLVLVNLDADATDAITYDRLRRQVAGREDGVYGFWQGQLRLPAAWQAATRLPHTVVIDREGRIAGEHAGRVPAEAGNQVADLLP
jgi:peroxiredoxin